LIIFADNCEYKSDFLMIKLKLIENNVFEMCTKILCIQHIQHIFKILMFWM